MPVSDILNRPQLPPIRFTNQELADFALAEDRRRRASRDLVERAQADAEVDALCALLQ